MARKRTCLVDWFSRHCCIHSGWDGRWSCCSYRIVFFWCSVINLRVFCSLVYSRGINWQCINSSTGCLSHSSHRCIVRFCWIIHLCCLNNRSRKVVCRDSRSSRLQHKCTHKFNSYKNSTKKYKIAAVTQKRSITPCHSDNAPSYYCHSL